MQPPAPPPVASQECKAVIRNGGRPETQWSQMGAHVLQLTLKPLGQMPIAEVICHFMTLGNENSFNITK